MNILLNMNQKAHAMQEDISDHTKQQKAVLREEILEKYEEIDYRVSDAANADLFSEIAQKFETIHISDLYHSKERKGTTYSTLRQIILPLKNIQRMLSFQVELL